MAFPHAVPGEARSVLPLGQALPTQQTHALFKSTDLEVLRLVLQAGQSLPDHTVRGEITIQCIEGELLIRVEGEPHIRRPEACSSWQAARVTGFRPTKPPLPS